MLMEPLVSDLPSDGAYPSGSARDPRDFGNQALPESQYRGFLHPLADTGIRHVEATGAAREPNPLRYDLIPQEAMERLAMHYSNGAAKYSLRNWEKGLSMSRCASSAISHIFKYVRAKALGRPAEEDHLAAAAWNCFALMTYEARIDRGILSSSIDDFTN